MPKRNSIHPGTMYVINVLAFRIIIITSHVIKDNWPAQCVPRSLSAWFLATPPQWDASESCLQCHHPTIFLYIYLTHMKKNDLVAWPSRQRIRAKHWLKNIIRSCALRESAIIKSGLSYINLQSFFKEKTTRQLKKTWASTVIDTYIMIKGEISVLCS